MTGLASLTFLAERPDRAAWLSALAVAGAAWIALLGAAGPTALLDFETLRALCLAIETDGFGAAALALAWMMWSLMSVAMMLPTALPAIGLYASLVSKELSGAALAQRVGVFALGYLLVWSLASIGFAAAQLGLRDFAGQGLRADAVGPVAAGGILLLAGLYQLTPLKQACLTQCRNPMAFFFAQWREGASGALAMGARHGVICVGCCWALMALMFVFGAMNLVWMAALGVLMLLEKAAPRADLAGRWIGLVLAVAGAALITRSFI